MYRVRMLLANNIIYFRHQKGWSQEIFAYMVKSSPAYISQLENAKRNFTSDFIDKLADCFDIEPYQLFVKRDLISDKRVNQKDN